MWINIFIILQHPAKKRYRGAEETRFIRREPFPAASRPTQVAIIITTTLTITIIARKPRRAITIAGATITRWRRQKPLWQRRPRITTTNAKVDRNKTLIIRPEDLLRVITPRNQGKYWKINKKAKKIFFWKFGFGIYFEVLRVKFFGFPQIFPIQFQKIIKNGLFLFIRHLQYLIQTSWTWSFKFWKFSPKLIFLALPNQTLINFDFVILGNEGQDDKL